MEKTSGGAVMNKTLMLALLAGFGITLAEAFRVAPEKYRGWNHVKSMVIFDQQHPLFNPFSGVHHVYVNHKGLEAIKKEGKRTFPDGTVIAIVFYEHVLDKGAYVEGAKRIEAFMVKDRKKYSSTDGWGYFGYDGKGNNLVKDMAKDCHSCHAQVKDRDFVFSVWTK
ncbi:MAG: cytochrome P460 family protein [Aquificaceae bacterium]|nr:cytochrome P460 family protein [Aquificaceae bacterium]